MIDYRGGKYQKYPNSAQCIVVKDLMQKVIKMHILNKI